MNNMKNETKIKVYFDGLCKVCYKEMVHYKRLSGSEKIDFIDICSESFDATKEQLDPVAAHKVMHVRRLDGSIATRVDAFIEIWKALPRYKLLAKFATLSPVHRSLEIGYSCFAALRPFLPRYRASEQCKDSPFCEIK